jgi:hypothetical protein
MALLISSMPHFWTQGLMLFSTAKFNIFSDCQAVLYSRSNSHDFTNEFVPTDLRGVVLDRPEFAGQERCV